MEKTCEKLPYKLETKILDVAAENIPLKQLILLTKGLELESRVHVEEQIRTFLETCKRASSPQLLVIRGEWGEGKTAIYDFLICELKKSYNYEAYLIRMDKIIDALKIIASIWPNVLSKAKWLIAAILYVIKGEERNIAYKSIQEYIVDGLRELRGKADYIIFFIDEFEAIIPSQSKKIGNETIPDIVVRSLREIRGGEVKHLMEHSPFHIILAMTPYAYNEYIKRLGITWRGWEERRKMVVDLYPLARTDAHKVLERLTSTYLGVKNAFELIFPDKRIAHLLHTISQGNLGALVYLCNYILMYSANICKKTYKEDCLCKMNYDDILHSLRGLRVFTYIGSTKAIDEKIIDDIMDNIRNSVAEPILLSLFTKFIVTSSVFFEDELIHEYGEDYLEYIRKLNTIISNVLGIDKAIIPIIAFREEPKIVLLLKDLLSKENDVDDATLIHAIRQLVFNIGDNKYLVIPYVSISSDGLEYVKTSQILSRWLSTIVPFTVSKTLMRRITEELEHYVEKCKGVARIGYTLSPFFAERIYPPPPVFALDFVTDRTEAVRLWKETARNITENKVEAENNIKYQLIKMFGDIRLGKPILYTYHGDLYLALEFNAAEIKVPVLLTVKLFWNKERARQFKDKTKYFIIVFTTFNLAKIIERDLKDLGLKKVLIVPLNDIRLTQLYAIFNAEKASKIKSIRIDNYRLLSKEKEILTEIDIRSKIQEKVRELLREGYVIVDPQGLEKIETKGKNPVQKLLNFYAMYLYGGNKFKIDDLWNDHLMKIEKTILYGKKFKKPSVMKEDIETPLLLKRVADVLEENMLIKKSPDNFIEIVKSPIENNILAVLSNYAREYLVNRVPIKAIKEHFIDLTRTYRNAFEDFYLKILELRGLIELEAEYVRTIEKTELLRRAKQKLKEVKENIKAKFKEDIHNPLYHIVMFKKKAFLVIFLDDVVNILDDYGGKLYDFTEAQLKLFCDYLDYIEKVLLPIMFKAKEKIEEFKNRIEEDVKNIEQSLKNILDILNKYTIEGAVEKSDIKELINLHINISELQKLFDYSKLTKEHIISSIKSEYKLHKQNINKHPLFYKNDDIENAYYFNFILFKIKEEYTNLNIEKLQNDLKNLEELASTIDNKYISIHQKIGDIKRQIELYRISRDLIKVDEFIKSAKIKIAKGILLSLNDLRDKLSYISDQLSWIEGNIDSKILKIRKIVSQINKLKEEKSSLIERLRELHDGYLTAERLYNTLIPLRIIDDKVRYEDNFAALREELRRLEKNIKELDIEPTYLILNEEYYEELKNKLSSVNNSIETTKGKLDTIVNELDRAFQKWFERMKNKVHYFKKIARMHPIIIVPRNTATILVESLKDLGEIHSLYESKNYEKLPQVLQKFLDHIRKLEEFLKTLEEKDEVKVLRILIGLSRPVNLTELIKLANKEDIKEDTLIKILLNLVKHDIIDLKIEPKLVT